MIRLIIKFIIFISVIFIIIYFLDFSFSKGSLNIKFRDRKRVENIKEDFSQFKKNLTDKIKQKGKESSESEGITEEDREELKKLIDKKS